MQTRIFFLIITLIFIPVCRDNPHPFEEFSHSDSYKTKSDFTNDSLKCWDQKEKYSLKIEGRKIGFQGQNVGYFGCMKLKGWDYVAGN